MAADEVAEFLQLNIKRAEQCAKAYSCSTGLPCTVIDRQGKTASKYSQNDKNPICSFCRDLNNMPHEAKKCEASHLYGAYQAERFGGKYVFFCHMGLVHWVSPITDGNMMTGALLGGPVLMVEPEEFMLEDYMVKNSVNLDIIKKSKIHFENLPVIKPDVVDSLSELLFITAQYASDVCPSKYDEEQEYLRQQADISDYIQHLKSLGGDEITDEYPLDKENELSTLISLGDKQGAKKILNEIFGHIFFSSGKEFGIIKARVLELVVVLSRAALSGGADVKQIFGMNYMFLNEINKFNNVDQLVYWLSDIMARFTDCVFDLKEVKHVDSMLRAVDYIKRNYMKKITLEEVAAHSYLSPSYFSKVFKDEMKCNFNAYLNNIRIEMSKKLLFDESISIVDVSNLVGFEDQSYYSKVFKKITGITPGKYKESRGKLKS